MNYKARLTILFVGLFIIVLTAILSFLYLSYSDFRREEFFERLREKSFNTARLLVEVKEVDVALLKIIDRNSINKMYDEKILVFDERNILIYSSLDDEAIHYSSDMIDQIRQHEDKYYVDADGDEVVGVNYKDNGKNYVILASAYDRYGLSKLKNLRDLLLLSLMFGTILIGVASYFYIRQVFKPIDALNKSIKTITENNLDEIVPVKRHRDELDTLAINYNQMLDRLHKAFESQRTFVRHAAHELKTPLALITSKLEELDSILGSQNPEIRTLISAMFDDVDGQNKLIESLLLIQRLASQTPVLLTKLRVDELLDDSIKDLQVVYPELSVRVDMDESVKAEEQLTIPGNALLIKLCFRNLISNATLHGTDHKLVVTISEDNNYVQIGFFNSGLQLENPELIFEPFYRQPVDEKIPGHGLGLSIVKQITELMRGTVVYSYESSTHVFRLRFPLET